MARRAIGPQEGGSNRGEKAAVDISVIDLREQSVATAPVALAPPKGPRVPLKFDKRTGTYRGTASPGRYTASVASRGTERQERRMDVPPGGAREVFVIGPPGLPSLRPRPAGACPSSSLDPIPSNFAQGGSAR